jgi:two-component system, NarL family, invasion response regulator UvrY
VILAGNARRTSRKKSRTVREKIPTKDREFFPALLACYDRQARHPFTTPEFILSGILVVDDHPVIARACGLVLEPIGIETIIPAYDAEAGYQAFLDHEPDISVIDLSFRRNELDGIDLIKRIRARDAGARILVFSMRADRGSFLAAIEAGATGYLIKDSPTEEFAKAVQQIRSGRRYIDPQLALNLAFANNAALSARERRILELLLDDVPAIRPSRH